MSISIIIPNYNGESLLKKNLPKVIEAVECYANNNNEKAEIIIVDDKSTDASIEEIQNSIPIKSGQNYNLKLIIIQNKKNLGFTSTINRGVKEAQGEIVVLLNTDVCPEKNFLSPLLEHFKNPNIFAVGCLDKSIEGVNLVLRGRGLGKWKRGFLVHSRGEVNKTNTLWVNGGSSAFRKSVWKKLGGFSDLYNPFYWEDIDLSYRALKSGYKILFEPKSIVIHEHEKGAINIKYSSKKIKTIAYRNQFIFVWRNADLNMQLLHILWVPYHLFRALLRKDFSLLIGFFKALIMLPKIIQSNIKEKNYFIKKDKEIINEFN